MKNKLHKKLLLSLVLLIFLSCTIRAQGIRITSGATCKTTGNACIVLKDAGIVNNGNFQVSDMSIVKMNGSSPQTIGGNSSITFSNLTIDNVNGIALANSESVSGNLYFINGKITLGANDLLLGISSSISGSGSAKYVVTNGSGSLRQRVINNSTEVAYPVGLATSYLPVYIKLTEGSSADYFSARVANGLYTEYDEDDIPTGSLISEDVVGKSWYVDESVPGGSNATIRIQWNSTDEATGFERSLCKLGHFDNGSWAYGQTSESTGSDPYSQYASGITTFSPFGVLSTELVGSLNGSLTYYNLANTPLLTDVKVKLYKDDVQVGQEYTVTDGTFAFNDLYPGDYELRMTSTKSTYGSINTTDAAQVNFWGANPYSIEKVRFYAGDVTGESFYINSSDAQKIKAKFVYGTPFDKGEPWTFWQAGQTINSNSLPSASYPVVTVGVGTNTNASIYGLCTGDFNRSFSAQTKAGATGLAILYEGQVVVGNDTEFKLPVYLVNASGVGAVSMIMNFPADLLEIKDVEMENSAVAPDWAINGNELRIGWFPQNPVYFAGKGELLTLKLKTTSRFTTGDVVKLTLADNSLNELADEYLEPIANATISVAAISGSFAGISDGNGTAGIAFASYPNPFRDHTILSYSIPVPGKVTIEISNILGRRIAILTTESQPMGYHSMDFNTAILEPGVYMATLRYESANNEIIKTIKIVKQ
jgi:hypothetical protein